MKEIEKKQRLAESRYRKNILEKATAGKEDEEKFEQKLMSVEQKHKENDEKRLFEYIMKLEKHTKAIKEAEQKKRWEIWTKQSKLKRKFEKVI